MDVFDDGAGCILALLTLGLAALLGVAAIALGDSLINDRRAFHAIAACEAKQMVAKRKPLSAEVVCVPVMPRPAGRDSLRVEVTP